MESGPPPLRAAARQTERLKGADRVLAAVRVYLEALMTFEPFRRFIQTETPLAFRLLTTRGGLPQGDFVELLAGLLTYEHEEHGMPLRADAETLAYAIVRVSEGFIYTDPVAEIEPDIDAAMEIASLLVK